MAEYTDGVAKQVVRPHTDGVLEREYLTREDYLRRISVEQEIHGATAKVLQNVGSSRPRVVPPAWLGNALVNRSHRHGAA